MYLEPVYNIYRLIGNINIHTEPLNQYRYKFINFLEECLELH